MRPSSNPVNNAFYDQLGENWYSADADPVALLRAESELRNPWVLSSIDERFGMNACRVLDIGCGAGFLANKLASAGHEVVGIDLSEPSLEVARKHAPSRKVQYKIMDAHELAFSDGRFDVVCAMDVLEHTPLPDQLVREASRVLKPGGLFFFHTLNRNPLSWLIALKGVEWFVRNTPKDMHVYSLFLKPKEVRAFCEQSGLEVECVRGVRPAFTPAFLKLLVTGRVFPEFRFVFSACQWIGYSGVARRR